MIWIELLGPSGVGKSFWYAQFMRKYPELEPETLLLKRVYERRKVLKFSFKIKLFFLLYNLRIPKFSSFFKNLLGEYFINSYPKIPQLYQKDNLIAEKYLQNVRLYQEPEISILYKIQYFAKTLNRFRAFEYYLKENDVFIAEDGILHLSPLFFEEINPDLAIVLEKDKELILRQRRERAKTNPRFVEELFNEKELQAYLENYLLLYSNKLASLDSDKIIKIQGDKDLGLETTYEKIKNLLNQ
jgi:hypothetical protein